MSEHDEDERVPVRIVDAPERIYLCYGPLDDFEEGDVKHGECHEVLWCDDAQDPSDVAYVRADTTQRDLETANLRLRKADESMRIARNVFEGMAAFYREQGTPNNDAIAALSQDMSVRMNAAVKALSEALSSSPPSEGDKA